MLTTHTFEDEDGKVEIIAPANIPVEELKDVTCDIFAEMTSDNLEEDMGRINKHHPGYPFTVKVYVPGIADPLTISFG